MDVKEKLKILSGAAKYDASCATSGSARKNVAGGIGNAAPSGICHSWAADGRCISLLKVLFTNDCIFDCAYCANRSSNDVPRATFEVDDLVELTVNFYLRNYIEGLFLSSAIRRNPDDTMESLLRVVKKLRIEKKFNGYIHVKAIPGANPRLISETGRYADRMSVNIELPTSESLKLLAPQKSRNSIFTPMGQITDEINQNREDKKNLQKAPLFVPGGQSTQLIVGATPESDLKIITLSEALYRRYGLKRVYYSAYIPINSGPNLPALPGPPLLREHRLYQADWLMRFYGFAAGEILDPSQQSLEAALDPKAGWALRNMGLFPVEVNSAPYEMILRVPGIGVRSAQKIVAARRAHSLSFDDLKKIGVAMKRAKYFVTCNGRYFGETKMDEALLRRLLTAGPEAGARKLLTCETDSEARRLIGGEQLALFPPEAATLAIQAPDAATSTTGEF